MPAPRVYSRSEHGISRKEISDNALKVLYRLNKAGYKSYLVGGCVRDLLMGLHPKDFDVATNATPEQVKELFRNCRLVGRRFRLAHVLFGREVIEVATFRGHHSQEAETNKKASASTEGQILRDNVFGSIEEDAERRDFTINAMYYDVSDFSVHDFADGMNAIKHRQLTLIGDPETRYREDPVRMLRAVRFAAKLDLEITPDSADIIPELAPLLANIPPARLFEEVIKLLLSGQGLKTYRLLREYRLFEQLFPILSACLKDPNSRENRLIEQVLINTDNRIASEQRVTPAFIYAAMLWYPVEARTEQLVMEGGFNRHDAFNLAMNDVLDRQIKRIMIPKRFSGPIRDIWHLQQRLPKRFGRRAYVSMEHARFRAAYDFLCMRAEIEDGDLPELADWWTEFQDADSQQRKAMVAALRNEGGARRRRPAKRRKPKA